MMTDININDIENNTDDNEITPLLYKPLHDKHFIIYAGNVIVQLIIIIGLTTFCMYKSINTNYRDDMMYIIYDAPCLGALVIILIQWLMPHSKKLFIFHIIIEWLLIILSIILIIIS